MTGIETERLILRRMTEDDRPALRAVISDAETMKYYAKPYDEEGVSLWLRWNAELYRDFGFGLFAVVLRSTGEMIGDCGITMQRIGRFIRPEIGYHFNKNFWRRGYAREASRAVLDWAFEHTPFETLYSYMNAENLPSFRTALSMGMRKVDEYTDADGEHIFVCALTRAAWEENRR